MSQSALVLNVGSSSVKFALYELAKLALICRGNVDEIGSGRMSFSASGPRAADLADAKPAAREHAGAVEWLLGVLTERLPDIALRAAGHRVVHGGSEFSDPVRIDRRVLAALERFVPLAPSHQPQNLAAIRAVASAAPDLPQVACFDTAFHRTQAWHAQTFALPRSLTGEGIVRYGFHGLSYEYLAGVLPEFAGNRADARVILAHLGHGASLCALRERRSVATTMGFTALDGLVMGRRIGAVDPGVLLYLIEQKRMAPAELSDLFYNRSGLLGVSGVSDDLRALEADGGPHAEEAMDLFAYRAAREIGSLAAALGGLDVLVFSAGIGEHSATMRARIVAYSAWLGCELDADANAAHASRISKVDSAVGVYVIPTDEEIVIARAVRTLL
ncbi:MAG TPA: acetate/propionate family kinase [Rhodanobacteraceae bacterium]|nr:acetate/propionate family kinase [Rhodanobacteraceae bacterium]